MNELLNKLITTLVGLGLLWGSWAVLLMTGIANNTFSLKDWSWKRTLEDVMKTGLMSLAIVAWVVLFEGLDWFAKALGADISPLLDGASTAGLIGGIIGGIIYHLMKAYKNILSFVNTAHVIVTLNDPNYQQIADDTKEFIETITNKTSKEQLKEDGVEVEDGEEVEAGKGNGNTYPEPYRSAPKDTLVDPSTCYNREAQPKGTMVTMADGTYKAIEKLKVGEEIFNHDLTETVIVQSIWELRKPVYRITTTGGELRFTGEHPLFGVKHIDHNADPEFIKTKDIREGDWIFEPRLEGKKLDLNEEELKALGEYLFDKIEAGFVPGSNSIDLLRVKLVDLERIREILNMSPKLTEVLTSVDKGTFVPHLEKSQAKIIADSFLDHYYAYAGGVYMGLGSKRLDMLMLHKIMFSAGYEQRWSTDDNGFSFIIRKEHLRLTNREGLEYSQVMNILVEEEQDVFNIEVSGSHTYIADNHAVHNCVSYTAWKICETVGKWQPRTGNMNARDWLYRLPSWGYKQVSRPVNGGKYVGVLPQGTYGHVVWFEFYVNNDTVQITEYNYGNLGNFGVRNIPVNSYTWFEVKAPTGVPTVTEPETKHDFKVGDWVTLTKWVDYNGTPLLKTANEYKISEINGNRAVLMSGNSVYAGVNTDNLKHASAPVTTPTSKPVETPIKVGDIVKPTRLVSYDGVPLLQYDDTYTVTSLTGDRAVLSARGQVWSAMNTKDLTKA